MSDSTMDHDDITPPSRTETTCRSCGSDGLKVFLDLGNMPLSDRFVSPHEAPEDEPFFPLQVAYCPACALVQITETVDPRILFAQDYPYYSSISDTLQQHTRANVEELIATRKLGDDALVVELASNDGYLLKHYAAAGIPVLGIDPAEGPAKQAQAIGVNTLNDFFTLELARQLAADGVAADVIHGNNVLAHVADLNGFVEGIRTLLKPDGVAVIEVPYLGHLIDKIEFDTVYHEHLCYFSLTALDHLFRRHGLFLNDFRHLDIHGGSLRLFVQRVENPTEHMRSTLALEHATGLDRFDYFADFAARVNALRDSLRERLLALKAKGKSIAGYGAAAKATIMINFCGLGPDILDFVADKNKHKQGKLMPGTHVPVVAPEQIEQEKPDYMLILAWNFAVEIMSQQAEFARRGGQFILPVTEDLLVAKAG